MFAKKPLTPQFGIKNINTPRIVSSKKAAGPIRFITGGVLFFFLKGGKVCYSNKYHKFQNSSIIMTVVGVYWLGGCKDQPYPLTQKMMKLNYYRCAPLAFFAINEGKQD